ncbi:MAG: hypothetical protein AMXMBFR23_15390 [Chloroflexota bacterium]
MDRDEVTRLLAGESDAWVQSALASVLERADDRPRDPDEIGPSDEPDDHLLRELRAQVTKEVTATLLHELDPMVGRLRLEARQEVAAFSDSRTNEAIDRIRRFLGAVRELNEASSPPQWQEFDLTDLVQSACRTEHEQLALPVSIGPTREEPVVVSGDPALVDLALSNAIRNGLEAVHAFRSSGGEPSAGGIDVVVNWGTTADDNWIAVIDQGGGLPSSSDKVFRPWSTTKAKDRHLGIGLTLARRAMESLGGSIELYPQKPHGALCELRWPKQKDVTR